MAEPLSDPNVQQAVPFLAVSDMASSLRFYVDGLHFQMIDRWVDGGMVRWCWLRRGGAGLMIQDLGREDGAVWAPEGTLGLGVSIVFVCNDALAIYREATGRGLEASWPFVGNGMWVTSLRDPDGYRIEFESQTDAPAGAVYEDDTPDVDAPPSQ